MEAVFGLQVTHCVFGFSEGEYFAVRSNKPQGTLQ
jgi:hypothetical protein